MNASESTNSNITKVGSEGGQEGQRSAHWVLEHSLTLTGSEGRAEDTDHYLSLPITSHSSSSSLPLGRGVVKPRNAPCSLPLKGNNEAKRSTVLMLSTESTE